MGEWASIGSTFTGFGHASLTQATGNYALLHQSNGETMLNAADGRNINFRINNQDKAILSSSLLSIGVATRIEQTLSVGGNLTIKSSKSLVINTPDDVNTTTEILNFKNVNNFGISGMSTSVSGKGNTLDFTARDYNSGSVFKIEIY